MVRLRILMLLLVILAPVAAVSAAEPAWIDTVGSIAIQHRGRTMPLDSYAKLMAVELTGRSRWSESRGPDGFAGKHRLVLLCDLLFRTQDIANQELIVIDDRPFKKQVGLDPKRRFFSPVELAAVNGIQQLVDEYHVRSRGNSKVRPSKHERLAQRIVSNFELIVAFDQGLPLQIVPQAGSNDFLAVSATHAPSGAAEVQAAFAAFGAAYVAGEEVEAKATALASAIDAAAPISPETKRRIDLELFYNQHQPFLMTAVAYGLALVTLGLSKLTLRKPLLVVAGLFIAWGTVEQFIGLYIRTAVLDRAPVSNTYEALLWMGLVAIGVAGAAQLINRKGWYLTAGLVAAELSVLFSMLVPLQDQTNALPPVLRNNYWLIVHVLTIVASYAVLGLAAVIGHIYLIKSVLFGKPAEVARSVGHPLITQLYRCMQIGLFLLTAGTILGGVWAADSWGRFWGWDPKETWAAISIVVYFVILHARHVGWLRDFGMAAWSILAFLCIVWTFYGVNYVMAAGLHSYGFGSGGEFWVGLSVLVELALLAVCRIRYQSLRRLALAAEGTASATTAPSAPPDAASEVTA